MKKMSGKIYNFVLYCFFIVLVVNFTNLVFGAKENTPSTNASSVKTQGTAVSGEEAAIENKLKNADALLKARNYIKAGELYREVYLSAKKGAQSEKALFNISKINFYLRRYNEARLNIKRFIMSYPQSDYLSEAYLLSGYIALYAQNIKEAQQYFDKVSGALEDRANIGKAEISLKLDSISDAESSLSKVSKKVADSNPRAIYIRAKIAGKKGMHKEAVGIISKIMEPSLKDEDLRYEKALIFYNAGKLNEAEKICRGILKEPLSSVEKTSAKKMLVIIYDYQGKTNEALKLSVDIMPGEIDDHFKLKIAELYDRKGDAGSALKYLNFLKDKNLKSAEIEKRLKNLIDAGNGKNIENVRKFSSYMSQDSKYAVDVSKYLLSNGKKFEGMALLKKAIKGEEKAEASLFLSELLINDGKFADAKKILNPLLYDARYFAKAALLMSEALKREGDYNTAIQYLLKAVKYSKDYKINSALADLYRESGDRSSAIKYYLAASKMGDPISSIRAADYYYLSGDTANSKLYYNKALKQGVGDAKELQWAQYQYGKLTNDKEYLNKAAGAGGLVGEAARIMAGGE